MEFLLMLIDIQGRKIAQKALLDINRVHEFELADMTHICCNRKYNCAHEPMDDTEVDEIIDEEEKDQYWSLAEATAGHAMPTASIYPAWVYKNPDKYDYPFPVDRDWYERRKHWATRQAEVLEGLS
jgi:hypothetical protein